MSKDFLERKAYRRSPGRQYGYDYDPLHSQSEASRGEGAASRSGTLLSQRPDPRRTRQLLRQSIIASRRLNEEECDTEAYSAEEAASLDAPAAPRGRETRRIQHTQHIQPREERAEPGERQYSVRPARSARPGSERWPTTSELMDPEDHQAAYAEEIGLESPQEEAPRYRSVRPRRAEGYEDAPPRSRQARPTRVFEHPELDEPVLARSRQARPTRVFAHPELEEPPLARGERSRHAPQPLEEDLEEIGPDEYDDNYIYEDHELPPGLRKVKSRNVSRRGLLWGAAGVIAAGGIGVAVAELAPKAAQSLGNPAHQIQQAFDQGVQHGIDSARKDWINALDSLEGVSLQGAADAAQLTRVAYDVFVSPVIQFGANLATDFLSAMLNAFKTARGVLAGVYQDNNTLIAIQKVLESWVAQVSKMPTQLNAITDTELDGAQSYLRSLQQKITDEKNKLNATPTPAPKKVTPAPKTTPAPTATPKPS